MVGFVDLLAVDQRENARQIGVEFPQTTIADQVNADMHFSLHLDDIADAGGLSLPDAVVSLPPSSSYIPSAAKAPTSKKSEPSSLK